MQKTVPRVHRNHGKWKSLSLQSSKSDKGAINSLKALKNTHIDLMLFQDGDAVFLPQRFRLHQAALCGQRGTGIRGNLHLGVNYWSEE